MYFKIPYDFMILRFVFTIVPGQNRDLDNMQPLGTINPSAAASSLFSFLGGFLFSIRDGYLLRTKRAQIQRRRSESKSKSHPPDPLA